MMANCGKIYLKRGQGSWQMKPGLPKPSGAEFEEFCRELESFVEGYFLGLGLKTTPCYVQGDFFNERTEAVHFKRPFLTQTFIRALQRWLSAPRRSNWRILIPGRDDRFIVVYHDVVAISPDARSLASALRDNGNSSGVARRKE
jgi:hypothetical protein